MKIAFVIDHLRHDGTQQVLKQLVEGLAGRRHTLAVVCLSGSTDPGLVASLRAVGAELRIIGKPGLLGGYGLGALLVWLRRRQFDVVVTMLFAADVLGRALARAAGVPRIVSSLRARNTHYSLAQLLLVRASMPWAHTVILNSWNTCEFAVAAEGARPERLIYIPNGVVVPDDTTPMQREGLRAELGLPPTTPLLGSVGRLTRQKGLDVLLEALVAPALRAVHLAIIGAGEEEGPLREQARALGLERRVHMLGYRRDVPQLLGALDVYVHPARFEGMPNALLEAMAAARPIVATDIDGNSELIASERYGWLVPTEDAVALAVALRSALDDPDEARRRGEEARRRATCAFSVNAMVEAWELALTKR